MKKKLIIIGCGGFGREVAWLVERINEKEHQWDFLGFVDDDQSLEGTIIDGYPILGDMDWLLEQTEELYVTCSIAKPAIRSKLIERCQKKENIHFPILVDPSAIIGKTVQIGEGSIICAQTIMTVDAILGKHVIINLACTIGHDAVLDDYVTLYPTVNVSGHVHIGTHTEIGTGTQIIQGLTIGEDTIVGAGGVVIRDIPSHCTAVGDPAKPIKYHGKTK